MLNDLLWITSPDYTAKISNMNNVIFLETVIGDFGKSIGNSEMNVGWHVWFVRKLFVWDIETVELYRWGYLGSHIQEPHPTEIVSWLLENLTGVPYPVPVPISATLLSGVTGILVFMVEPLWMLNKRCWVSSLQEVSTNMKAICKWIGLKRSGKESEIP